MAGEYSTAGTKFYINDTPITGLFNFPDIGSAPNTIDVTSFDDEENERAIPGLMPVGNLEFEFHEDGENYAAALEDEGKEDNTYKIVFKKGRVRTWHGSHVVIDSGGQVNNPVNFKIACTVNGRIEHGTNSSGGSGNNGN